MKLLTGIIYSLTFLYIVYGNAHVDIPSSVKDDESDGQIGGQLDNPVNTLIHQEEASATTQPAVVTTSLTDLGKGETFIQTPFHLKLISKANNIDHNEDKNHRSLIVTNVEAYKLSANNLLIRSRFVGAIDWILHKPDIENKVLPFSKPEPSENYDKSANHLKMLLRHKRQADSYGMPNPMNGQGAPMRPGDQPMGNNSMDRVRQFFGRLREIVNDIRKAFSGNSRVDINMQGMGNMPGMEGMPPPPNVPK